MSCVSIIVPCYNASPFLDDTVASVLRQRHTDWELVLVDDGSTDNTAALVHKWAAADPRIRAYCKANEGTTRARNFGYAKACADTRYLWFLDHDDQLREDALEALCAYLDTHAEVGLLACQYEDISEHGVRLGSGHRSRWRPGLFVPHEMRDDEIETPFVSFFCATGQGPFAMYRRSVYELTEGWTTAFWPHEDTDMFCQMALLARVHFLPTAYYLKRSHAAQGMNDAPRVQRAYAAFRQKWDQRKPRDAGQARLLNRARRYYYSTHRPFRDLKVAARALGEVAQQGRLRQLKWALQCVASALYGMVVYRITESKTATRAP